MMRSLKVLKILAGVVLAGIAWSLWGTYRHLNFLATQWNYFDDAFLWRIVAINLFPFLALDVLLGIMAVRALLGKRPLKVPCWIAVALLATRLFFMRGMVLGIFFAWMACLNIVLLVVAPALLLWRLLAECHLFANAQEDVLHLKASGSSPMPRFRLVEALADLLKIVAWLSLAVGSGFGLYAFFKRSHGGWYGDSYPFRHFAWCFFAVAIVYFVVYMILSAFCAAFVQSAGGWRARIQRATGSDADLPSGSRSAWLLFAGWILRVFAVLLAKGGIVVCCLLCRDKAWLQGVGSLLAFALMGLWAWTQGEIFFVQAWCGAAGKLEMEEAWGGMPSTAKEESAGEAWQNLKAVRYDMAPSKSGYSDISTNSRRTCP